MCECTPDTVHDMCNAGFDPEPSATGVATWALQDALNGYDDFLLHVGDIR